MRKRFLTAALIALVAAIGVLLSSPTVGARPVVDEANSASANNPKADIQQGNFFCGADLPALPVIGFTNYHRVGNRVNFTYHLKGAVPNSNYRVELWRDTCTFHAVFQTVTTNQNGVANASASTIVPAASTRFFATAFGPNGYDDTPAVTLLP